MKAKPEVSVVGVGVGVGVGSSIAGVGRTYMRELELVQRYGVSQHSSSPHQIDR